MLTATDIKAGYQGSVVLEDLSIKVDQGEAVALLGANGAGKTTLMRVLAGLMKPYSGSVTFDGADVTGLRAFELAARGLILVPERRRIFYGLTVLENLEMGAYLHRKNRGQVNADLEFILSAFSRLRARVRQLGGTLSGGEQQMLAIARGLMSRPKLMMVDEPSLGLAPLMVKEVFQVLHAGWDWKPTLLICEQNAILGLRSCQRGYVLQRGHIRLAGDAEELRHDRQLFITYFGEDITKAELDDPT